MYVMKSPEDSAVFILCDDAVSQADLIFIYLHLH